MHCRKLRPSNWPVAAGVTSRAVTNKVPTTCTITTTTAAVVTLNNRPMLRTGRPWTRAETGSTAQASKPCRMNPRMTSDRRQIRAIKSRLASSIRFRFPKRYDSISVVRAPPPRRRITSPRANIPVRKMAIDASPVSISLDCISWIRTAAVTLKTNAYDSGEVAPRTIPTATPPNATCASPSPISARCWIKR